MDTIEKRTAALLATARVIVAVLVSVPEVPVTVITALPMLALALAVRVRVLVAVVLAGLKAAVTPLGKPEAVKLTLPLKPPWGATVIVAVPLVPCLRERLAGAAVRV